VDEGRRAPLQATPPDEAALVAGCRAGHTASLDQFFRRHVHYVERVIGRLAGPTLDLEDLVQTTFIEAIQSFKRYRGEANLKTWVTRIAVNVTLHQLRRGVRRQIPLELIPEKDEPADPSIAPDREVSNRQLAHRLHELLDRITPKKRIAFLLYTVGEHSIDEVAALTSAGKAATKSRIWFARRELLALVRERADLGEDMRDDMRSMVAPGAGGWTCR
jgi:RNA polymerase sigma-70 factor (ECF subfamily)